MEIKPVSLKKTFFIFLFVSCVAVLLFSCSPEVNAPSEVFVVGVALDYANSSISDLNTFDDVTGVVSSFRSIYEDRGIPCHTQYLIQRGADTDFDSRTYPTAENIFRALEALPLKPEDLLVFYFAGHGTAGNGMTKGHSLLSAVTRSGKQTSVDMTDLFEFFDSLCCRSVVILDCCYSGFVSDLTPGSNTVWESIGDFFSSKTSALFSKLTVMAAASASEQSYEVESNGVGHGVFTKNLLAVMGWVENEETKAVDIIDGEETVLCGYHKTVPESMSCGELFRKTCEAGLFPLTLYSGRTQSPVLGSPVVETIIF